MIVEYKELVPQASARAGLPYLNESFPSAKIGALSTRPYDYAKIIQYIKKSPECLGIFNTLITDIISDGVYFTPHKKQGKKTNIQKAEDFWRDQNCKQEFKKHMLDWLMLGNGTTYLGLTRKETKEAYNSVGLEFANGDNGTADTTLGGIYVDTADTVPSMRFFNSAAFPNHFWRSPDCGHVQRMPRERASTRETLPPLWR